MDWSMIRSKIEGELLPEEKSFSVVKLDTMKPPDHPECASKFTEVDDLDEVEVSETDWYTWIAYDADGNSYDIR